jgi:phage terminase small subunit
MAESGSHAPPRSVIFAAHDGVARQSSHGPVFVFGGEDMGARGKAPTPTATLKLRHGDKYWRVREREGQGEIQPPTGRPLDPPFISDADRELYDFIIETIDQTPGLLTVLDGFQLERYCRTISRWRQVETELEQFNSAVSAALMDDTARQVIRSLWAESRACDQQLKQTEDKFGLTPSARTRIRLFGNMADAAKAETAEKGKGRFFRA